MCLIVLKQGKEAEFTNIQFNNMISRNQDGLGIMWVEKQKDGSLRVRHEKTKGGQKEQFKLFQKHRNKTWYAMHARFKTHGANDLANCHPYKILDIDDGDPIDLYMMHNGVINVPEDTDTGMSDTWNFIEGVLKPMFKADHNLLDNKNIRIMIDRAIGASKLLFMRNEGEDKVVIINKQAGDEIKGCWLSNLHSTGDFKQTVWEEGRQTTIYRTPVAVVARKSGEAVKEPVNVMASHVRRYSPDAATWWDIFNAEGGDTQNVCETEWNEDFRRKTTENATHEQKVADIVKDDRTGLFLPAASSTPPSAKTLADGKVVDIKTGQNVDSLAVILQCLKASSDDNMVKAIMESPLDVATIITFYYTKTALPWNELLDELQDEKKVRESYVNLIRSLSVKDAA